MCKSFRGRTTKRRLEEEQKIEKFRSRVNFPVVSAHSEPAGSEISAVEVNRALHGRNLILRNFIKR